MVPAVPDANTLAALISNVTETMCGITFTPAVPQPEEPSHLWWRVATLQIAGDRHVAVTLSSDRRGCEALGSALLGLPAVELDAGMIDDSLKELLNMAAGQIKSALALEQPLGLPSIVEGAELGVDTEGPPPGVVLRSRGQIDVVLWIETKS